jgi:hypothetical protein
MREMRPDDQIMSENNQLCVMDCNSDAQLRPTCGSISSGTSFGRFADGEDFDFEIDSVPKVKLPGQNLKLI